MSKRLNKKVPTGFPNHFLWGGAVAANQCEGAYLTDGKQMSTADIKARGFFGGIRRDADYYPTHNAIDFYHTYREDLKLMSDANFNIFRTSINWTRIYPTGVENEPNMKGIEFYKDMFEYCHQLGMKVMVTISHYETPLYLVDNYGGWDNRIFIDFYMKFVRTIVNYLGDVVDYWLTFNEIGNAAVKPICWDAACIHPDSQNLLQRMYQAAHHQFVASALAVKYIHEHASKAQVGAMIAYKTVYPYTCKPEDVIAAEKEKRKEFFFSDVQVRGHYPDYIWKYFEENNITIQFEEGDEEIIASYPVDFITFSYYRSRVVSAEETEAAEKIIDTNTLEGIENPYLPKTDWGWTIDPDGLMLALQELAGRYEKPLFISENGLGAIDTVGENHTINDIYRIQYMKGHIEAMKRAIENGVNLFGYTMWGPIDIVSNGTGQMSKRYGIIYVDLDDNGHGAGKRYKKRSYDWYKKVIASNGEELSIEK